MSSHIQLMEAGRLIGLDGGRWAPQPVNPWSGFPCELHGHMRRAEVEARHNPHALVFLRYESRGRSRITSASRVFDLDVAPRQVDVYPAGFRMDHGWWDCTPGGQVSVELRPGSLGLLGDELGLAPTRPMLSGIDPTLATLIDCMRSEIVQGCPSGRLYAEWLSLALLGRVRAAHGGPVEEPAADQLATIERRRIVDYVEAHLGEDLRNALLAALVERSVSQFARTFRRTFGQSPHRYVLERRLLAAHAMLGGTRSLASIAIRCGFASQAHFTAAYGRRFGSPPGAARRA